MTIDEEVSAYIAAQRSHRWRAIIGAKAEWRSAQAPLNNAAFYECEDCHRLAVSLAKDYGSTTVTSFGFVDCYGHTLENLTCKGPKEAK